jgi:predicted permease
MQILHSLRQDLAYGARQLRRSPGFALTAILTLALGIGATTALFSVVDGVLLKPLEYRDSGRLVAVWERVRFLQKFAPYLGPNPRHFDLWRRQADNFSDMTLLQLNATGISRSPGDHPAFVGRVVAQPNLLDVLGVQPALGRGFLPVESTEGHQHVAILSWGLWQRLFHGEPDALGKTVQLSGVPHEVVGILPQNFYLPKANEFGSSPASGQMPEIQLMTPLVIDPTRSYGWMSDFGNYIALGHLKPGVSLTQATDQLDAIADYVVHQAPSGQMDGPLKGALAAYVEPMKEAVVGRVSSRLWLLLAAVSSVLLIASVNLANAQLARFAARDRESAVRSALGASSFRLLQTALAEVVLLSTIGGLLGIALAYATVHWFSQYAQLSIPRTGAIRISLPVLGISVALTVAASVVFGVLPALRMLRVRPQEALNGRGPSTHSRWSSNLRRVIVAAQVFLCATLLLTSALFARSLVHLVTSDKGFSADHVVAAGVFLPRNSFSDSDRAAFDDGVLARLRSLPGVESASLTSAMLLEGETWLDGIVPAEGTVQPTQLANIRWISPDYFSTLQQRIVAGRALNDHDRGTHNAVISQNAARALWPGRDVVVGRQFRHGDHPVTVVGVVADSRNTSLRAEPVSMVYVPYWDDPPNAPYLLVRTKQDPTQMISAVRNTIWSYNPDVTISRVYTLDDKLNESLASERMETSILLAFGGAALLLALLGIYGTLSYAVQSRTQEIGVRMALGASRQSVYRLMLGTIFAPVLIGLALGWAASLGIGRSLASLLYNTAPTDPGLIAAVMLIFFTAAAAATFIPCRHAAAIDPMEALRTE